MGMFNKLFGDSPSKDTAENRVAWKPLTEISQLDDIAGASVPVLIFKHSTRCGISNMVLKNFERHYDLRDGELEPYFLDLLSFRRLSDEIASRFGVLHQSPQILVIKDGKCLYTASHSDIDAASITEKIRS